ncbi:hypothetical protein GW916_06250 [bacterium]|nr:hypothetical protein [bacterium]
MAKLTVAGLGIKDLLQMTVEAKEAILSADRVVYLGTDSKNHLLELKKWGVTNVQSIIELYVDGDIDVQNYQRIYEAILSAAREGGQTVLLVPGHPRIGVSVVQHLSSRKTGLELEVLPGVSSFDTMINDLHRDPLEKGSLMVDANRALLFGMILPSTVDCYIYHVCSVGTQNVHVKDAQKDNSWDLLKEHLLKIYEPSKRIELVCSTTSAKRENQRHSALLENLEELKSQVHFGTTMFIQADRPKNIDRSFYSRLLHQGTYEKSN